MGRKKYYGYKPKFEHYSVTLYIKRGNVGEQITFCYENGSSQLNHYLWGSSVDYDYSSDGEVEQNYYFDEENTKRLMLRTGTKNGKNLVSAIHERFQAAKSYSDKEMRKWCDTKGIEYHTRVWY